MRMTRRFRRLAPVALLAAIAGLSVSASAALAGPWEKSYPPPIYEQVTVVNHSSQVLHAQEGALNPFFSTIPVNGVATGITTFRDDRGFFQMTPISWTSEDGSSVGINPDSWALPLGGPIVTLAASGTLAATMVDRRVRVGIEADVIEVTDR